jgi:hypothetical protein
MKIKRVVVTILYLLAASACANEATAPTHEDINTVTPSPLRTTTQSASPTPVQIPPLTLADIFPPRDLSELGLDPARIRTLIATGDVIPARYTDFTIREQGDDFLYTVRPTAGITSNADITVINLEAPLIEHCPMHVEGFVFCGRPGFITALQEAGVDVVTRRTTTSAITAGRASRRRLGTWKRPA